MRSILTTILLIAATAIAHGQQDTILTNATIIDGTGNPPILHSAIVIRKGKIVNITRGKIAVSPEAVQYDMTGKYIIPELIDCHAHVGNLKGTSTSSDNYTFKNVQRQLFRFQEYGVGAILSMGTEQPIGVGIRDSSKVGLIPGATLFSAIYGFGVKGAMPPESAGFTHIYRPSTPEEAVAMVRELVPLHPDVIKMWVDDFYGQFRPDQIMKPEIYTAIIKEAHANGIRVAAHLYHLADAHRLVDAGVDIMAHSIRDAEIDDALIAKMKAKHVSYIPTLSLDEFAISYEDDPSWLDSLFFRNSLEPGVYEMITSAPYKQKLSQNPVTAQEKTALPIAMKNLLRLYHAGIPIALGTDAGASPVRAQGFSEHMELELMVKSGLTPMEVLKIATFNGARLLHIDADRGTLEKGKRADFIVLDRDPTIDIRNTRSIVTVWKNGWIVSDAPTAPGERLED
jgi:imidazolonepropionase-like amidohydrolase